MKTGLKEGLLSSTLNFEENFLLLQQAISQMNQSRCRFTAQMTEDVEELYNNEDDSKQEDLYQRNQNKIQDFRQTMTNEIDEIQKGISQLESQAKTFKQRQDVKKLKEAYSNEMDQFSTIMKNVVKQSFDTQYHSRNQSRLESCISDTSFYQDSQNMALKNQTANNITNQQKYQQNTEQISSDSDEDYNDSMIEKLKQKKLEKQQSKISGSINSQDSKSTQVYNSTVSPTKKQQNDPYQVEIQMQQMKKNQELSQTAKLDNSMMQERQEKINDIEHQMYQINEIMNDMNMEVVNGQEVITQITENVEVAKENTKKTNVEMHEAQQTQRKNMKCTIFLVIAIIIIVGGGLGLYFGGAFD